MLKETLIFIMRENYNFIFTEVSFIQNLSKLKSTAPKSNNNELQFEYQSKGIKR